MNNLQKLLDKFKSKIFNNSNIIKQDNGIYYVNWIGEKWLEGFIKYNFPDKQKYNLCLCSVEGKPQKLQSLDVPKIFFSGENLEPVIEHNRCKKLVNEDIYKWLISRAKYYGDYRLDEVNLAMGYAKKVADNYLRFPLWLMYLFPYDVNIAKIKSIVDDINAIQSKNINEAACINRHDVFGIREFICNDLSNVLTINYAGKWRNNTEDLWKVYNNDKLLYLKNFKFNICPENMDAPGYCTEKIFDALRCGCIPIYAGCLNNPEPEIINQDFVIFWDLDGGNYEQIKLVNRLNKDDNYYQKFMKQPKLKENAADYIAEYFENLKYMVRKILENI